MSCAAGARTYSSETFAWGPEYGAQLPDLLREDLTPYQAVGLVDETAPPVLWPDCDVTAISPFPSAQPAFAIGSGNLSHQQPLMFSQLPSSWHGFLAGLGKQHSDDPDYQGADTAPQNGVTGSQQESVPQQGLHTRAEQGSSQQEAKQQRIREKNRRAMQKFRTKQKVRHSPGALSSFPAAKGAWAVAHSVLTTPAHKHLQHSAC